MDQVLAIALDYLSNDEEVQEAMEYIQSDAFHNIVTTLEGLTEFESVGGINSLYKASQILCTATDSCRYWPWLACRLASRAPY